MITTINSFISNEGLKYFDYYYFENIDDMKSLSKNMGDDDRFEIFFDGDIIYIVKYLITDDFVDVTGDVKVEVIEIKATEKHKYHFSLYDKYLAINLMNKLIKENDIQFNAGGGYYHLTDCGLVDGRIVVTQGKLPTRI